MKFWLPVCVLILATSCSHGSTTPDGKAAAAPAPAAKAAPAADDKAPKKAAKSKSAEGADHCTCKGAGGDERSLEIISKGAGCAVEYTKQSQKQEIASAEHEKEHCKQVMQKVRGHLEAAGFTCN